MAGESLSTYLVRTRRLLHDLPAGYVPNPANTNKTQFFSDFDLTVDINDAIVQRDMWSAGTRSYQQNVPLTIGQDVYAFSTLFPALYAPPVDRTVIDVVTAWLLSGSTRVQLRDRAFSTLTDEVRQIVGFQNRPWGFSRYGAAGIYIAPAPGAAYGVDFDLVLLSTSLAAAADPDPMPRPYTIPVPFYAAYLAKLNQHMFDDAELFFGYYTRAMRDIEGARVGDMMTYYAQDARRGGR